MDEHLDKLRKDAAEWLQLKDEELHAAVRRQRADADCQAAADKAENVAHRLARCVGPNLRSVMTRVTEAERTVVVRWCDGSDLPVIEVFDRDGKLVR